MKETKIQIAITISAIAIAIIHMVWPTLVIDAATVALVVAAILPWLAPIFKKLKVVGLEVEFQELRSDVESMQVALKGIVTKYEHEYLRRLHHSGPFPSKVGDDEYHYKDDKHHYSPDIYPRLKRLDDIGFIRPIATDAHNRRLLRIEEDHAKDGSLRIEDRPLFKLSDYVEITSSGQNYLKLAGPDYLEDSVD